MPEDFTDEFVNADLKDAWRNRRVGKVAIGRAGSWRMSPSGRSWPRKPIHLRLVLLKEFAAIQLIIWVD
jgi:hypothetical protein